MPQGGKPAPDCASLYPGYGIRLSLFAGDRVQRLVLGIFGFACLVGGIVSTGLMLYYFLFMLGSGKPEKKQYSRFLGPLVFFFPQLWDEEGNRARVRTLVFALLFAACFGGLALVHNLSIQLR